MYRSGPAILGHEVKLTNTKVTSTQKYASHDHISTSYLRFVISFDFCCGIKALSVKYLIMIDARKHHWNILMLQTHNCNMSAVQAFSVPQILLLPIFQFSLLLLIEEPLDKMDERT